MMTNYMELLMTNQPWNLILFMVIPVGLAEFLVATEFYTLFLKDSGENTWARLNGWLGRITGLYFAGVFLYLMTSVVPHLEWRGWADVLAVGAYLSGIIPLLIGFLVVSHVAMVFGMVDPAVTGWQPGQQQEMSMHSHTHAAEMQHGEHMHE